MLTDDEDVDDDDYTFDAMIDVRRNSLLDKVNNTTAGSSTLTQDDNEASLTNGASGDEGEGAEKSSAKGHRGRGPKPASLNVNGGASGHAGGERSPSSLASPLEKLRKAAEEEEGEGKELEVSDWYIRIAC